MECPQMIRQRTAIDFNWPELVGLVRIELSSGPKRPSLHPARAAQALVHDTTIRIKARSGRQFNFEIWFGPPKGVGNVEYRVATTSTNGWSNCRTFQVVSFSELG